MRTLVLFIGLLLLSSSLEAHSPATTNELVCQPSHVIIGKVLDARSDYCKALHHDETYYSCDFSDSVLLKVQVVNLLAIPNPATKYRGESIRKEDIIEIIVSNVGNQLPLYFEKKEFSGPMRIEVTGYIPHVIPPTGKPLSDDEFRSIFKGREFIFLLL